MSADEFRVLVVCTGNLNRSALGAVLLQTWAGWYLPASVAAAVQVTSAGLGAPVGSPMAPRTLAIAEALGADGSAHRAVQITEEAIRGADLVLVSSTRQRDNVLGLVPGALRSTFTIREAGRITEGLPGWSAPGSVEEMRARVATIADNRAAAAAAAAASGDGGDDIVDPQGKDDEAYRQMARQEVPPLARIGHALFGMPPGEVAAYQAAVEAAAFAFDGAPHDASAETRTRPRGRREA